MAAGTHVPRMARRPKVLRPQWSSAIRSVGDGIVAMPLSQGMEALVNSEDIPLLSAHRWYAYFVKSRKVYLAMSKIGGRDRLMSRTIMGVTDKSVLIDHKNGNTLDNRRENLRVATPQQNARNSKKRVAASSRFKGVCWAYNKWRVRLTGNEGQKIVIGHFDDELEAALAYDEAAPQIYGEFARTNKMLGLL